MLVPHVFSGKKPYGFPAGCDAETDPDDGMGLAIFFFN
jgi:hypothetical protein